MTTQIKASPNKNLRHYTVRIIHRGQTLHKYRTERMSREDFQDAAYNTERDWSNYIRFNELKKIK